MIALRFIWMLIGFKWFSRIVLLFLTSIAVLTFAVFATLGNGLSHLGVLGVPIFGGPTAANVVGMMFVGGNSSAYIQPTNLAQNQIPEATLTKIREISVHSKCNLGWPILAAVGYQEDRSYGAVRAIGPPIVQIIPGARERVIRAYGPAQFLLGPGSWLTYGDHIDPPPAFTFDPVSGRDIEVAPAPDAHIWQPEFAYAAMDAYLCALGGGEDPEHALWAYSGCVPGAVANGRVCVRNDTYVADVLARAQSYGSALQAALTAGSTKGLQIVAEAQRYVNAHVPYKLGGASFANIDCSGLTMNAVLSAYPNIALPHNAQLQWNSSFITHIPADQAQPGDLVFFWGTDGKQWVSHVGVVSGHNQMINAPDEGFVVSRTDYTAPFWASHFYGIGRING